MHNLTFQIDRFLLTDQYFFFFFTKLVSEDVNKEIRRNILHQIHLHTNT